MYAASFVLVIVALITLIIGVFQSGLTFIWISIAASILAAIALAVGVLQKKPVQPATAGAPYGPPAGATDTVTAESRTEAAEQERPAPAEQTAVVAPPPPKRRAARPAARERTREETREEEAPAPRKAAPRKAAAEKRAPAKAAAGGDGKSAPAKGAGTRSQVVAIPERGTYHVGGCRFVRGRRDTEKMAKATASRRGYSPCGVCRP